MRDLIYTFETTEGVGDGGAGGTGESVEAPVEAGAVPSSEAGDRAETPAEGAGAPSPADGGPDLDSTVAAEEATGLSRDEIQTLINEGVYSSLEQIIAASQQPEAPAAPPRPDPLADDYDEQLEAWFDYKWQERMGGVQPVLAEFQNERATQVRDGLLDGLTGIDGYEPAKPAHRQAAEFFGSAMLEEVKASGLRGERAAAAALRKGAEQFAAIVKAERDAAGQAAVSAYQQQIGRVESAPSELGAGGAGTEIGIDAESEAEVVERLFGRQRVA